LDLRRWEFALNDPVGQTIVLPLLGLRTVCSLSMAVDNRMKSKGNNDRMRATVAFTHKTY